jgi:cytochrome c biogenesis protein CcmG/thiol:disulfide interchange protein DsbE
VRAGLLWLLALAALVAVVAVGLHEARTDRPRESTAGPPGTAEIRSKLADAPPALAALHRQANVLLPGERAGLRARLRALRGHPVVVNVWAAWCGPCRAELPVLQRVSLDWGTRVGFLGVDLRDSRQSAARLLAEFPVSYPSFEDPHGTIAGSYRLVGTPSTIYFDAAGRQTHVHPGPYLTRGELDADIRRYALGGRS